MASLVRMALRVLSLLYLAVLLPEVAHSAGAKGRVSSFDNYSRIGVGYIYASPIGEKFDDPADAGQGLALCLFTRDKLGYGMGAIEYVNFDRSSSRESVNYYQINLTGTAYVSIGAGLHATYGAIIFGYHNWDDAIRRETNSYFPFIFRNFLVYPATFHSLGLGYELFLSGDVSIDLAVKYSFDLSFSRTYWQINVSTGLFEVGL